MTSPVIQSPRKVLSVDSAEDRNQVPKHLFTQSPAYYTISYIQLYPVMMCADFRKLLCSIILRGTGQLSHSYFFWKGQLHAQTVHSRLVLSWQNPLWFLLYRKWQREQSVIHHFPSAFSFSSIQLQGLFKRLCSSEATSISPRHTRQYHTVPYSKLSHSAPTTTNTYFEKLVQDKVTFHTCTVGIRDAEIAHLTP